MSKAVNYLICNCGTRNEAKTHQLSADNWFQERQIDYAECPKCAKHILKKRFITVKDELISPDPLIGYEKIWNKYQDFLRYEIQRFDNDYLRAINRSGGLVKNVYYARFGSQYRTDHISTRLRWNGEIWKNKKVI